MEKIKKPLPPVSTSIDDGQLAVDIYQTAKEIIILAPIAGVDSKDVDVSVTDEVLTIKGARHLERKIEEEDYFTKECFWGGFSRSIILPESAELGKINATFEKGILEIRIPRGERIKTKVVRIKTK
ncbi:MAG: Hsp20/alpha crystallin family protein [Patescibacteria group bacterium]